MQAVKCIVSHVRLGYIIEWASRMQHNGKADSFMKRNEV